MAKSLETIDKNGLQYTVHPTHLGKGETKRFVGNVTSPAITEENYQDYIDGGITTLAKICQAARKSFAIELQAELRRQKTSGKITKDEYNTIFNTITSDGTIFEAAVESGDAQGYLDTKVLEIWQEERDE